MDLNWEAIGATGEILGAAGVIFTIMYLAVQIRQNTGATRAATAQNLVSVETNTHNIIATDEKLASILQTGVYDPAKLSPEEQFRFNALYLALYIQYDLAYRQYLNGQLDAETWERLEHQVVVFASMPGGAEWWKQDKARFSKRFVEYLDAKLEFFEMPETVPTMGPHLES